MKIKRNILPTGKRGKRKGIARAALFTLHVALCTLLLSCSNDELEGIGQGGNTVNGGNIEFAISFAPQTRVATDVDFNSEWEDGDEIGLFAVPNGQPLAASEASNYIHNVKLTYSSGTWSGPAYWPANSSNITALDFYAYYPYDVNATDPTNITFNVQTDQSETSNYNKSDLLRAEPAMNIAKGQTVVLTFSHIMAMVQVEVDPGTVKGSGPSEHLTLSVRPCKAGGTFDLGGGSLSLTGDAQAVKMLRVEQAGDPTYKTKYTYRALVPEQTVATGTSLCLMAQNGQLYNTPALASTLDLSSGDAKRYTTKLPATALQTVKIPAGTFMMGSPAEEPNRASNETQHEVTLTKDFYMSKYPITNAQYAAFLNAENIDNSAQAIVEEYGSQRLISEHNWGVQWDGGSSKWKPATDYENNPVINVTWYGAKAYADWIGSSLPTEAQWEYACRASTTSPYSYGDSANGDYMWYTSNSGGKTHEVGIKIANSWGLYDMHGNVWEWCLDNYRGDYQNLATTDPVNLPSGSSGRVLRGGSWNSFAQGCRSACRDNGYPGNGGFSIGFRVVLVP